MSLSRKIFAGVLIAGALGAGAVPANAVLSDCTSARMCMFNNANYGEMLGWRYDGGGVKSISWVNNDLMSSWSNKSSSYNGAWYKDSNGQGACFTMARNTNNWYVGNNYNDMASSWRTGQGC